MLKVQICKGTVCHVMGGADLPSFIDFLPEQFKKNVSVEEMPCLGVCNNNSDTKPPFVKINNEIISEVTVSKLLTITTSMLK